MSLKTIPEEQAMAFMTKSLTKAEDLDQHTFSLLQQARATRKELGVLRRNAQLDEMARQHAMTMAQQQSIVHSVSSVADLQEKLGSAQVGENVHRGRDVPSMHAEIMLNPKSVNRANLMSAKFDEVGTGTILGEDGLLYSCQVFRGSAP